MNRFLKILISGLLLLIIAFVALMLYCNINGKVMKEKGFELRIALKSYQSEYGRYPDSIHHLAPKYYDDQKTLKLFENGSMTYWSDSNRQCFRLGIPASLVDYWILTCGSNDWEYQ
jgi:hypothetical protein